MYKNLISIVCFVNLYDYRLKSGSHMWLPLHLHLLDSSDLNATERRYDEGLSTPAQGLPAHCTLYFYVCLLVGWLVSWF